MFTLVNKMNCTEIKAMLSHYLDGELSPRLQALMEKHLEECPACNVELMRLERTVDLVASLPVETARPDLHLTVKRELALLGTMQSRPSVLEWLRGFGHSRFAPVFAAGLVLVLVVSLWISLAGNREGPQIMPGGQIVADDTSASGQELTAVCLNNHQYYSVDLAGLPFSAEYVTEPVVFEQGQN